MTINTKFSIGDTIYYMKSNQVCNSIVCSLRVQVSKGEKYPHNQSIHVIYSYTPIAGGEPYGSSIDIHESQVFMTKKELLDSL